MKTGLFESTGLGRIASYYYLTNASVATYNEYLKPNMTEVELFRIFSMSHEFSQIVVRPEEKLELDMLMKKVPMPIRETVENPCAKVNVLLQTYFSREPVPADMRRDTLALLPTAVRLLHVGVCVVCEG